MFVDRCCYIWLPLFWYFAEIHAWLVHIWENSTWYVYCGYSIENVCVLLVPFLKNAPTKRVFQQKIKRAAVKCNNKGLQTHLFHRFKLIEELRGTRGGLRLNLGTSSPHIPAPRPLLLDLTAAHLIFCWNTRLVGAFFRKDTNKTHTFSIEYPQEKYPVEFSQ